MAGAPARTNRALSLAMTVAKFVAAWGLFHWMSELRFYRVHAFIHDAIYRILSGFPSASRHVDSLYDQLVDILGAAYAYTLFFGTGLAVVGALVRMVARAGVRAGEKDLLDRLRAWTAAHPRTTRALLLAPGVCPALLAVVPQALDAAYLREWVAGAADRAVPLALAVWGIFLMAKKGLRELLAPTLGGAGAETHFQISPDEIAFDAVAVTPRTLGLVGAFLVLMITIPLLIAKLPILELYRHGQLDLYLFGGYAAFAAGGAYTFRKASRVAVGVDGVHVHGTARSQFFAYRDLEAVRTNGADIELVRRGRLPPEEMKVVLRLQLHGEDAARRDAILARITNHIVVASERRGAVAAQIVATASKDELARLAQGGGDYRMVTVSRDHLWGLVEGPEVEASARRAAAEALARGSAVEDRARLRVAAAHCADPVVRGALEELAGESDEARGERRLRQAGHAGG